MWNSYTSICRFYWLSWMLISIQKDSKKSNIVSAKEQKSTKFSSLSQRCFRKYKLSTQLKYPLSRGFLLYTHFNYKFFFKQLYYILTPHLQQELLCNKDSEGTFVPNTSVYDQLTYSRLSNYLGYFSFLSFSDSFLCGWFFKREGLSKVPFHKSIFISLVLQSFIENTQSFFCDLFSFWSHDIVSATAVKWKDNRDLTTLTIDISLEDLQDRQNILIPLLLFVNSSLRKIIYFLLLLQVFIVLAVHIIQHKI